MGDPTPAAITNTKGAHYTEGRDLDKNVNYAAIVIGAGFGGLRMLHELRKLSLSARVIEAGSDVGGTWCALMLCREQTI